MFLKKDSNAKIKTNMNTYKYLTTTKVSYVVHIPRYKIYSATTDINYNLFFSTLSNFNQKKLSNILQEALVYNDMCRTCFGLPKHNFSDPFVNKSFIKKLHNGIHFEVSNESTISSNNYNRELVIRANGRYVERNSDVDTDEEEEEEEEEKEY